MNEELVASQTDEAEKAATQIETSFGTVGKSKEAKKKAAKVASATTLKEQRNAFASLSNKMVSLVIAGELSMGKVFLDYCP